ncbi:MCP four helix bundle domain-containing protein [Clostridium sp. PL3]|uniref:MCP four helix bundle domain-containing protein n=1 Tax=Clostridium thailandense TaxID=2794346 RepID=A0A949TLJ5_9CLOT|nr:methyl-accepting chemotaxis protein [Clostridium thailandense]MBV7275094.1 MCP four helix bundle domain-containing protein [Clostridium thailandense]
MEWINNLKVGKKLTLLISCSLISLITIGIIGYIFLSLSNNAINTMYNERLVSSEYINEARIEARAISADIFRLMVTEDENENEMLLKDIDSRVLEFNNDITSYKKMKLDTFENDKLNEMEENLNKYRDGRKKVLDLANQNKNTEAYELYKTEVDPSGEAFMKNMIDLGDHNKKVAEELSKKNQSNFTFALRIFISIVGVAAVVIILLGLIITKHITKRLNNFVAFIDELSKGNFSNKIPEVNLQDKSEFGLVSNALDLMTKNIVALIKQLTHTSEQLLLSSEELTASTEQSADASNLVADSVTDVAQGADKQSLLSNTTAESVKKMSDEIYNVSQNTNLVSELTDKATASVNEGEKAIDRSIEQMRIIEQKTDNTSSIICDLEDKSKKIGQIIEVIESISSQTNLLALNAAIEASRAGEAGRGFSVVADEIRKLAEQSQGATEEITTIINDVQSKTKSAVMFMDESKKEVDTGTDVVNIAGQSFSEILKMVSEISNQVYNVSNSINAITNEAKAAVISINDIRNISTEAAEETQTISAAAEQQSASIHEIAESSKLLAKMSEDLSSVIRKFRI